MRNIILAAITVLLCNTVSAQTLKADPVLPTEPQPVMAVFTVNGGTNQTCTLTGIPKVMSCSLTDITIPGKYTLVAKYIYEAGCNGVDTCWAAGEASSDPFIYNWTGVPAQKPIGVKIVTQ